jgi:hypothetical protein
MFERDGEQSVSDSDSQAHATQAFNSVASSAAPGVPPKPLVAVRIQGLTPSGFLKAVEEGSGRVYELTPDGNSLDMMAGLLRRKIY